MNKDTTISQALLECLRDNVFCDIASRQEWSEEVGRGKMFGVLVVRVPDDISSIPANMLHDVPCNAQCGLKALYAYSGQILGRSDWDGYVPAIFDYLQEDGYFKSREADISSINVRVRLMENSAELAAARAALHDAMAQVERDVSAYRLYIKERKATRTTAEAQFQNAELRRLKQRGAALVAERRKAVDDIERRITQCKAERRERSDALQRWLFTQHRLVSPYGTVRPLLQVFSDYARTTGSRQAVPPSGTGECCAPRLFNYANAHGLKPVALSEFWYGESPKGEIRHHGQFYEPCQSKCVPILWWLKGQDSGGLCSDGAGLDDVADKLGAPLYEDDYLIAVDKPAGVLSVPGRGGQPNVEDALRAMRPECRALKAVHRLDMHTSGVLLVAKDAVTYTAMQALFAGHNGVRKEYVARLSPSRDRVSGAVPRSGTISLPLSPDFINRPRQRVDTVHGKRAVTLYEFLSDNVVRLSPLTGRTHQLRVHCAHTDGLGMPILGDPLYGCEPAPRMYLHACLLEFRHPVTGKVVTVESPCPFL
ncbi:MAG: RluA family pseudouridine synthase [Prevotellaceae bacterium]|nr:RluA family pseudouridine synthase [Prevotellaceae bacterium]